MSTAEEIIEDFDTYGVQVTDNKLAQKCLELCSQYEVDGDAIAISWLVFATSNGYSSLTIEHLEHFERDKLAKEKKTTVKKIDSVPLYDINTLASVQDDDELFAAYGGTPTSKTCKRPITPENNIAKRHINTARAISAQFSPATLQASVATPSQKYSSRTNVGGVLALYGDASKASWTASNGFKPQVKVMSMNGESPLTHSYKYMFEKLRDAANVMDDTIMTLAEEMQELLHIQEFASLKSASNDTISVCGRICCDSVGRLNAASVLLEGSRENTSGGAIPLDLSQLAEFSLFPGQIVGVEGVNTTGSKLVAQQLFPGKVLPLPDSPITVTDRTGPVQVMVACGPFTTTDNLLYEPLTDLLTVVQENPPHLLILMGPLLDVAHPLVANNTLDEIEEAVFNRCIRIITSTLENIGTQVVLVSSHRDLCSPTFSIYPTPPYNISGHITCVSDPALLDIEGIVVAMTSTDILFHLGKEETSFPPQGSDRLGRLARHILRQQSLYPLYPSPEGVCVDKDKTETHARLPCTPHLLILPSDLRYFVRDIEGCVVVNPERIAKGLVGGTYVRLEMHAPSEKRGTMVGAISAQIVKV